MLGLGLCRQPRGVGRHEGEGMLRIVPVFRQIEMHATDQIPGRVQRFEEGLKIGSRPQPGMPRTPHSAPSHSASRTSACQILRPRHHRRGQHESGEFSVGRRRQPAGQATTEPPRLRLRRAGTAPPHIAPRSRATRRRRAARPGRPRPPPAAAGRAQYPGQRPRQAAPQSCRPGWERPRPPRAEAGRCGVKRKPRRDVAGASSFKLSYPVIKAAFS